MVKHSITLSGHRTSLSLEQPFWDELQRIAKIEQKTMAGLIGEIDRARIKQPHPPNLSSALRLYVLDWVKNH